MKPNPLLISGRVTRNPRGRGLVHRENPPPDEDAAPKIVDLEEDDIRRVTLRSADADPITVERGADDKWQFGDDLEIAADDAAIGGMVASLASLNADRVVSESVVEWGPYELEEPALAVAYELQDGGGELQFGRNTPTGSGRLRAPCRGSALVHGLQLQQDLFREVRFRLARQASAATRRRLDHGRDGAGRRKDLGIPARGRRLEDRATNGIASG